MSNTTERLGSLTRQRATCAAGGYTYIRLDTNDQRPATVFVRNASTNQAVTVFITCDDDNVESPLMVPLNIGALGTLDHGESAAAQLVTPVRAVIVQVPEGADAPTEVVVLK